MIEAIYISVGSVHQNVPKLTWEKMASEMSHKFKCEVFFADSKTEDTTLRVDGDLTIDEMFEPHEIFGKYLDLLN